MLLQNKIHYKVLLIENDLHISAEIKQWLHETCTITHASDKSHAINLIYNQQWDLVITDIKSVDFNDLTVTKLVKEIDSGTSVLIITANQKVDFIINALHYHADGFLFKPLEKDKFVDLALRLAKNSHIKHMNKRKVVLAIGAHPDDVEIGCGGSLALHYAKGHIINILTLSLGEVGGNPNERKLESEYAAKLQHANLFLRKLPDTKIPGGAETISIIEEVVDQIRPTHVYTHSLKDNHQDHRKVHQSVIVSCRSVPNLYCYQSPSSTVEFKPNLFIDITPFIKHKIKILSAYKTQQDLRPYLKNNFVYATARYWGRFSNYSLTEPMEIMHETHGDQY